MHDLAPLRDGRYRVAIFNPGSNPNQVSRLRLVNPGAEDAQVTITGIDDAGASPGTTVGFDLPAGRSTTLTATELESGVGVAGALGDGVGKWRLAVTSAQPVIVMSLLSSPTGHLTNLSTAPDRGGNRGAMVRLQVVEDGRRVVFFQPLVLDHKLTGSRSPGQRERRRPHCGSTSTATGCRRRARST